MELRITKEQETIVNELIASGRIGSIEDVVSFALDQLKADGLDLAWAKPLVDEGLADFQRGDFEEWDATGFLSRVRTNHNKSG